MVGRTCKRQQCQAYAQPLVLQAVVNARKPLKQCPMQWCLRGAHFGARVVGQEALLAAEPTESFAKRNPTFEGVCMGNRKTCRCGAPFLG